MKMARKYAYVLVILACLLSAASCVSAAENAETGAAHQEGPHEDTIVQAIMRWLNFAALAAILYMFFKKQKVKEQFKEEADEIQRSIESARKAKEEAEMRLQELDTKMLQANDDIAKMKQDAAKEAEDEKGRILESAQKEAERIIELANREIDSEIEIAKRELKRHVTDLSVQRGKEIIEKEIGEQDQKRLIKDYIEGFGK